MLLVLGFLTGLALVAPIGPVALTLFGIGAEQGRRAALAGAAGVVLADAVTMPIALGGAGLLDGLDAGAVRVAEFVMGVLLVGLALVLVLQAEGARRSLARITRPTRTLAAMTLVNPLSVVAWLGVALALPATIRSPISLAVFGGGLVLASAVWHAGLATVSGSFGPRLGERPRTLLTRGSGVFLFVVGGVLVV